MGLRFKALGFEVEVLQFKRPGSSWVFGGFFGSSHFREGSIQSPLPSSLVLG
jgi:hypothetical protein